MNSISRFAIGSSLAFSFLLPFVAGAQFVPTDTSSSGSGGTVFTSGSANPSSGSSVNVNNSTVTTGQSGTRTTASGGGLAGASDFNGVVDWILVYFNYFIYLITALTVVYTIVGAFNMIGSEDKREDGKTAVYHGIIGLFVMMSIWGFVNILDATFRLSGGSPITPRTIESPF